MIGRKTLAFNTDNAEFRTSCFPLGKTKLTVPNTDLAKVEELNYCCLWGLGSAITKHLPLFIGTGCDQQTVNELYSIIKLRYKEKGELKVLEIVQQNHKLLHEIQESLKCPSVETMSRTKQSLRDTHFKKSLKYQSGICVTRPLKSLLD